MRAFEKFGYALEEEDARDVKKVTSINL